jgi:glycosyltransferase domain-containing protein
MNNFTLIIPTHKRHLYLKRSIEYFKNLKAEVIYCDSSEIPYEGELNFNIEYLHLPEKKFAEKILIALGLIKTDFVALCADDDFIIIDSLYKGCSFLTQNKKYSTIIGKYICFNEVFDGNYFPLYNKIHEDINYDPVKNAKIFFQDYYQVLWAMYNKEVLIKAFQIINTAKFQNDNFIELVIGACACHEGGLKFLNDIWGVRELNVQDNWGKRHTIISNIKNEKVKKDYLKFQELIDDFSYTGYAKTVIDNYLKFTNKSKSNFLKNKIKKILPDKVLLEMKKYFSKEKSNKKIELIFSNLEKKQLNILTKILNK